MNESIAVGMTQSCRTERTADQRFLFFSQNATMIPSTIANRIQILEVMSHSILLSLAHDDPTFR
jgi:hypothetical protein